MLVLKENFDKVEIIFNVFKMVFLSPRDFWEGDVHQTCV